MRTLTALHQELTDLIIRIAGLTDPIIKEQCKEQYDLVEKEISEVEKFHRQRIIKEISDDLIEYYTQNYRPANIIQALEANQLVSHMGNNMISDFTQWFKKNRIAPFDTFDRRRLIIISDILQKNIIIQDMEGLEIDRIGKQPTYQDTRQVIILYAPILSRISDEYTIDHKLPIVIPR